MKREPGLYDWWPYVDRPKLAWPNGARVAFWVAPNIEFYELDPPGNPSRTPWARPLPDVAPEAAPAPPEDVAEAEEPVPAPAPAPEAAQTPPPDDPPAAPPEATDEIVPEEAEPSGSPLAVARAQRPPRRPSDLGERVAEAASARVEQAPAAEAAPAAQQEEAGAADDVAAALAEAASSGAEDEAAGAEGGAAAADPGPPMTGAERDAFRVAVRGCWSVNALSSEAQRTTVTVVFELGRDRRVAGDVELLTSSGGSGEAARTAFEAARRAVLRCQGQEGFPLPEDKYEQWRLVEMTFDPTSQTIQ